MNKNIKTFYRSWVDGKVYVFNAEVLAAETLLNEAVLAENQSLNLEEGEWVWA